MISTGPVFAYLGPAGTYSDEATRAFAARLGIDQPQFLECTSFDEVFDCVDRGKCEYGVVAKENSLEGSVTATLDNFAFKSSASILGEEVLDIHHCLVMHPDAKIEDITTVASHAQGLGQCRRFLSERLPGRNTITTSSTAESARLAASDLHVAGIANAFAADLYGARIHERDIEDHFGNQTAFALIGRQGHAPVFSGEKLKTSLALFLQVNRAGTLHMILSEFAFAGIDLSMIQSRPTKQALGDYMFFIEFEGSENDHAVQTALNCLRLKLREVKVLGSYPIVQHSTVI
ncbi:MAG: prephenate dehydratase [Gordonibacter sp.]|nr:prephenate dehydratase [Gordonibacter sp.]